eukprot:COSAG01_NODE_7055_length_3373_cov_74.243053_2_plen_224_part_00
MPSSSRYRGSQQSKQHTTIDNPPNTQHAMLEPLVRAIVEACAKQRGRSSRNIPSYVNVRTMVDLIKALGADATCSIVAWHSQGELKAQREGLLECIELALKHEVFTQKAHGTNCHYARAALRVMKEELEAELMPSATYSIFDMGWKVTVRPESGRAFFAPCPFALLPRDLLPMSAPPPQAAKLPSRCCGGAAATAARQPCNRASCHAAGRMSERVGQIKVKAP